MQYAVLCQNPTDLPLKNRYRVFRGLNNLFFWHFHSNSIKIPSISALKITSHSKKERSQSKVKRTKEKMLCSNKKRGCINFLECDNFKVT